jgi:hypothetical protein
MAQGSSTAKSSWSRAPIQSAAEVGTALKSGLLPVADRVGKAVRGGIGSVGSALEDPAAAEAAALTREADLPELDGEDPLSSMSVRLDREADLYRGIALKQLARAAWMDRLAVTGVVLVIVGEIVLAAIAGFRALFSAEHASQPAILLLTGALLLLAVTAILGRVVSGIRAGQIAVARDALARADLAEARLHRLAALLAIREGDPEGYPAALRALEGDIRQG